MEKNETLVNENKFYIACEKSDTETIEKLINKGICIDCNKYSTYLYTPLQYSILEENFEIAKFLIKKGADFKVVSDIKQTLLHWVIMSKNFEITKLLVDHGSNVNASR